MTRLDAYLLHAPAGRMAWSVLRNVRHCPLSPTITAAGLWSLTQGRYTLPTVRRALCELGRLEAAVRGCWTRRGWLWAARRAEP